ncbi:MAG: ABC transporter ATP-binding protein [Ruminococcaceae bacterium]|nr:ABC transporter ATP-binding protein [Oscillospiraceae bacterium]
MKNPIADKEHISAILLSKGFDPSETKVFLRSDKGQSCGLCDCYVLASEDECVVLSVREELKALRGAFGLSKRKSESVTEELEFFHFDNSKLERFFCRDDRMGGSVLAVEKSGDISLVFCFTAAQRDRAREFCLNANKLLSGEVLEKEEHSRDRGDNYCPKCKNKYPDPNTRQCPHCMGKSGLVKKLLPFFARYKFSILATVLLIVLGTLLSLVVPYMSNKLLYNEVLDPKGRFYSMIGALVAAIVGVSLVGALFEHINSVISSHISANVTYDLKRTIFENLQRLSMSFFTGRQTGSLMTQVNSDAETLYWFFCDGVPYFITNTMKFFFIFVLMICLDWRLAAIVFVPIPLIVLMYRKIMKGFSRLHARNFAKSRRFNSSISDVLSGFRVVKAFAREEAETDKFDKQSRDYAKSHLEVTLRSNRVFPLINFIIKLGTLLIWAIGGWFVVQNSLSGGKIGLDYASLMLFLSYMSQVSGPITFLGQFTGQLSRAINSMRRLFEVMDTVSDVAEKEDPEKAERFFGDVVFDKVGFSYEVGRKTLDDVSFALERGKTLGIVGHTGAGKSTLANLLTRLYDVNEGKITIDGVDIKDYSFETLHKNISIVSQETYLFRGSIMDNIRYACPTAGRDQVIFAAKAAGAHDFIMKMPHGYNTVLKNGKDGLSGGERQRISIARAILNDPSILILDEATASMDTATERMIQNSLDRITQGRTTIIIAHRLSTLRNADSLIVIKNGKMIESGTHNELMEKKGEYYKLYMLQLDALKMIAVD